MAFHAFPQTATSICYMYSMTVFVLVHILQQRYYHIVVGDVHLADVK